MVFLRHPYAGLKKEIDKLIQESRWAGEDIDKLLQQA
jgi:hypothetical protein